MDGNTKADGKDKKSGLRCYNCDEPGHTKTYCPNISKGLKCYTCHEFGHLASNCSKSQVRAGSEKKEVLYMNEKRKKCIQLLINNDIHTFNALIDTGADVTTIRKDAYEAIGSPNLKPSMCEFNGFGSSGIPSLGTFATDVKIDHLCMKINFHVVESSAMSMSILIGNDVLDHASVFFSTKNIQFFSPDYDVNCSRNVDTNDIAIQCGIPVLSLSTSVSNYNEENDILKQMMAIEIGENDTSEKISLNHIINKNVRECVLEMINKYVPDTDVQSPISMKIVVTDENPVFCRPRKVSQVDNEIIEHQISEWLQKGIIQESVSNYSSPVVLVNKKNGSKRLCIDFRRLNKKIVKDRYPLPLIETQLDCLQKSKYFSTLDLVNGFFHVPIDSESQKYTSFVTMNGQYEFKRVPFGLCNSPSTFQRYINMVFQPLIRKNIVRLYMDDVVVLSENEHDAVENLRQVLAVSKKNGLFINWKKCQFLQDEIEYLGYLVKNGSIRPSPDKVRAVQNFPMPKTVKKLHSFLGLASYFRKFIENFATIAKPLSDLLRKGTFFQMNQKEIEAFKLIKQKLLMEPVLMLFKYGLYTELHTDASKHGYGAVLLQRSPDDEQMHPVYYMSRKTTEAEENYHSYELEVLAIIEGLKKFRVYLLGLPFKIVTDCAAFEQTMKKKELNVRVARWALLLEEFNYEIEHRKSERMKHVDALSRNFEIMYFDDGVYARIKALQASDAMLIVISNLLEKGPYEDFVKENGILYKSYDGNNLLVVPESLELEIIRRAHEIGHFAIRKTKEIVVREFFIFKIDEKIKRFISTCVTCIGASRKSGKKEGLLNPIPKGDVPLHTFHIDHLGPLESTSKQYKHILAITDSFSKYVWLFPTKSTDAKEVIKKLQIIQEMFGNPVRIVCDKGSAFTSHMFEDYCEQEGIKLIITATGVPRGNGQIERTNGVLIPVLTKLSLDDPAKWYVHVKKVQMILNSTYNRSINKSPFEILIGTRMNIKEDIRVNNIIDEELQIIYDINRCNLRQEAVKSIEKIQTENRQQYNKSRKEARKYKVGDTIYIKRTQQGPGLKLKAKFFGPYKIIRTGANGRFDVEKVGYGPGPKKTTTAVDMIKPYDPDEIRGVFQSGGPSVVC